MAAEVRFISKRNQVWKGQFRNREAVYKRFEDPRDYQAERRVYQTLMAYGPDLCPQVLDFQDQENLMILTYLPERTALEVLEEAEGKADIEAGVAVLLQVIKWLTSFYRICRIHDKQEIMGDINLRNFLWDGEKILGIDFENVRQGDSMEEIIRLLAFYALYDPAKTAYKSAVIHGLMDTVLDLTQLSLMDFQDALDKEMDRIVRRRKGQATNQD